MAQGSCQTESVACTWIFIKQSGNVIDVVLKASIFPYHVSLTVTPFERPVCLVELAEQLAESVNQDWTFENYMDFTFGLIMTYISKCTQAEANWRKNLDNVKRMYQRKLKQLSLPQKHSQLRAIDNFDLSTYFYDSYWALCNIYITLLHNMPKFTQDSE